MRFNWPLIGHQHLRDYFTKAFAGNNVHHAYLFTGPDQVGKTTFAKMLVNTLLCDNAQVRPCGQCQGCQGFAAGVHPDVLTLKAGEETSISVEKAREFIASISLRPLLSSWRVGMIEGAAELTLAAANALLKTLEEPPRRVVLFLISAVELLPTIASRCQWIRFGFVRAEDMKEHLTTRVHEGEAEAIVKLAYGCPGRAIDLLQPEVYETRRQEIAEVEAVLGYNEAKRTVWAIEKFGGKRELAEKREECLRFIVTLQQTLRERLENNRGVLALLKRTFQAEAYLKANVDPKFVMECFIFS